MLTKSRFLGSLLLLTLVGCSPSAPQNTPTPAASTTASVVAYPLGSRKKGDKALCVVCVVKEGSTEEETVVETLDYKGHTYVFCNEAEKADFISDPRKYAGH